MNLSLLTKIVNVLEELRCQCGIENNAPDILLTVLIYEPEIRPMSRTEYRKESTLKHSVTTLLVKTFAYEKLKVVLTNLLTRNQQKITVTNLYT